MKATIISVGLGLALCVLGVGSRLLYLDFQVHKISRTMNDMKTVAQVLESFKAMATDGKLPRFNSLICSPSSATFYNNHDIETPFQSWPGPFQTIASLKQWVEARRPVRLPVTDAWGHSLLCCFTTDFTSYTIVSLGRDGLPAQRQRPVWDKYEFDSDLIFADGRFISWPDGFGRY